MTNTIPFSPRKSVAKNRLSSQGLGSKDGASGSPGPDPMLSLVTAQRLAKLEDILHEVWYTSFLMLNERVDSVCMETERLYGELVETNRRATSLDRYETAK